MLWRSFLLLIAISIIAACQPAAVQPPAPTTSPQAEEESLNVAFVLPGLINDGAWNTLAYESFTGAESDLEAQGIDVDITYVERSPSPADAARPLRDFASEGYDVVWGHSGTFITPVLEVAPEFPDTTFVGVAGPGLDLPDNVWIVGNDQEDSFFLAGAIAGLMTESNQVGFVGGVEIPIYVAGGRSFEAGAKHVNPDVEVSITFVGDFNDPTAAKEAAIAQYEQGVDIIQHSLNLGAFGVFEAAREQDGKVIGLFVDQKMMAPQVVLVSVIWDYRHMMAEILSSIDAGEKGGYLPMNLPSGGARLSSHYGEIPEDVEARIEQISAQLIAGEIDYPKQADVIQQ